jgi:4-diphosphocytidyl-2-C-methyl-D-erythritol kinase
MKNFLNLPAPAKLNLFLHIVGKREDGMHLLQSAFQLIDLQDYISLEETGDGRIVREGDISWNTESDLCCRAARLLQEYCPQKGVRIRVKKNIPTGAGLGGGSSDAATTLIALNRLWNIGLSREKLLEISVQLGADVPFFIGGQNAFVEGIGEKLTPLDLPQRTYMLIMPQTHVSTKDVFGRLNLTELGKLWIMPHLYERLSNNTDSLWGKNDLEGPARSLNSLVDQMFEHPFLSDKIRMTGSGAAAFFVVKSDSQIAEFDKLPGDWRIWRVQGLKVHPLKSWL